MGSWATPYTDADVTRLEALMAAPLPAAQAADALYELVGDDTLFDAIQSAVEHDPNGDVRLLVAMTLDEWTNWMHPDGFVRAAQVSPAMRVLPFDEGCWERLQALAASCADVDPASVVGEPLVEDSIDGARAAYSALWADGSRIPDMQVARTGVPGIYAVKEVGGVGLARVEIVYGVISEADPRVAATLEAACFAPVSPSPAP